METIAQDIEHMRHQDAYKRLLKWLDGYEQAAIDDMISASSEEQAAHIGKVAAYREILATLRG